MRVLLIKMSSLGDLIHAFPALTDALNYHPTIRFDWVVEENFVDIPRLHPAVDRIIPIALRRWRQKVLQKKTWHEIRHFRQTLTAESYDWVIDAQGLIKSAVVAWMANGPAVGWNRQTAREPWAAFLYNQTIAPNASKHAIDRIRYLFSAILQYSMPNTQPVYGLQRPEKLRGMTEAPYIVFLHGTTWGTKHWPESHWIELAKKAKQSGWVVKLPWGNVTEKARAERIALHSSAEILPALTLNEMSAVLAHAHAVVSVDTGLGHLSAAFDVPTVSLYGPTDPLRTGMIGKHQTHLTAALPCAPCFSKKCRWVHSPLKLPLYPPCLADLTPEGVWSVLETLL